MIVTSRCAKWLQHLPESDAAALIDAVVEVAAAPLDSRPRCKKLAPNLYEARLTLHHRRAYRCMFGFRPDGAPVLLSACLKTSGAVHQREIEHARHELTSAEPREGVAMSRERPIFTPESGWLYSSDGRQLRIVHMTRRKVVIDTDRGRVELRRAHLEQDGQDVVDGVAYRVSRYALPIDLEHIA